MEEIYCCVNIAITTTITWPDVFMRKSMLRLQSKYNVTWRVTKQNRDEIEINNQKHTLPYPYPIPAFYFIDLGIRVLCKCMFILVAYDHSHNIDYHIFNRQFSNFIKNFLLNISVTIKVTLSKLICWDHYDSVWQWQVMLDKKGQCTTWVLLTPIMLCVWHHLHLSEKPLLRLVIWMLFESGRV